jgi:hypothetical protein
MLVEGTHCVIMDLSEELMTKGIYLKVCDGPVMELYSKNQVKSYCDVMEMDYAKVMHDLLLTGMFVSEDEMTQIILD